jgi:hypothetical protein
MLEITRNTTTIRIDHSSDSQFLSNALLDVPVNEVVLGPAGVAQSSPDTAPSMPSISSDADIDRIINALLEKRKLILNKPAQDKKLKVLVFSANPRDTTWLRIDEEVSSIDKALYVSKYRDHIDIRPHFAVKVSDLQELILRHKPNIVHFSGHGSSTSQIILEDARGRSRPVSARSLSNLFKLFNRNIRCVVLNACFSQDQASAIAQHIDCVVGMSKAISDAAAIRFAAAFYQSIGYGESVRFAFDSGIVEIDLDDLDEQNTPQLISLRHNPENMFFF